MEGNVLERVAGAADFLVDLKAALQGAAIIGAERTFEGELLLLGRQAVGIVGCLRQRGGGDTKSQGEAQRETKWEVLHGSHSYSPSTGWEMEAGNGLGVSKMPTSGMIGKKKPK